MFQGQFAFTFVEAAHLGTVAACAHGAPAAEVVATGIQKEPVAAAALADPADIHLGEQFSRRERNRPEDRVKGSRAVPTD